MKSIIEALADEVAFPLDKGMLENKLLKRGICATDDCTQEVLNSDDFTGAYADCLYHLIEMPNFSESDISISLADRKLILDKVNDIYRRLGEEERKLSQPNVYIGNA